MARERDEGFSAKAAVALAQAIIIGERREREEPNYDDPTLKDPNLIAAISTYLEQTQPRDVLLVVNRLLAKAERFYIESRTDKSSKDAPIETLTGGRFNLKRTRGGDLFCSSLNALPISAVSDFRLVRVAAFADEPPITLVEVSLNHHAKDFYQYEDGLDVEYQPIHLTYYLQSNGNIQKTSQSSIEREAEVDTYWGFSYREVLQQRRAQAQDITPHDRVILNNIVDYINNKKS